MWEKLKKYLIDDNSENIARLFKLIQPKLKLKGIDELAQLTPDELADLFTSIIPDIPMTDKDNKLRFSLAEKLIAYAQNEVSKEATSSESLDKEAKQAGDLRAAKKPDGKSVTKSVSFKLSGRISSPQGEPLQGLIVRAFDQGLRKRRGSLGEDKTGDDGGYSIRYDQGKLLDPKSHSANLMVEIVDAKENILIRSDVSFNARQQATINLTVDTSPRKSEWERLQARLKPALKEVALADLTDDDLDFIISSQQLTSEQLKPAVQAARAAKESELPDWFHYALQKQGLPKTLNGLLETSESSIMDALDAAQRAEIIATPNQQQLATLRKQLAVQQADYILKKPMPGHRLKTGKLFELAGLSQQQQCILARGLIGSKMQSLNSGDGLPEETGLDESILERVRFTLALGRFADDHEATIKELVKDERIQSRRDLARYFDPQDWQNLVERTTEKDTSDLPDDLQDNMPSACRTAYARRLYTRAAEAFPTVAMAYGLSRHQTMGQNCASQLLPRIVDSDETFDLATVRLGAYMPAHSEKLGLKTEDVQTTTQELKRVQRLYRLKPEMSVVALLLEGELDSATKILHTGQRQFIETYGIKKGLGREAALTIFQQAEIIAARAFGFYSHFSPAINTSPLPAAIRECPAELKGVPDYPSLFGTLDGCECEPCESVYSPAAYLTDLLAFLEREVEAIPGHFNDDDLIVENGLKALASRSFCNAQNQLIENWPRRPDITGTLLSCRNAETELPYVDLVLEILENAVAPRNPDAVLQTSLSATELAVQPEYLNENAYEELASAVFPFNLPFDLWHEEETIYLEKLGTHRVELLETFYPFKFAIDPSGFSQGEPHDLTEIRRWQASEIAQARLGLSDTEWKLISGSALALQRPLKDMWGFADLSAADSQWWHPLRNVETFLTHSRLDYKALLQLVRLRSFNPTGAIGIADDDLGECDPKAISLKGLSVDTLEFLHRFLRLQRKLDWTVAEVDQLILSLSPPQNSDMRPLLDEAFLLRLSHLIHFRDKFRLPLSELLSWWSMLDSQGNLEPQLPGEEVSPSLYEKLFLSGRVGEPEFEVFQLNTARTELKKTDQKLSHHLSPISSALRLIKPDLERLVADLFGSAQGSDGNSDHSLNLANLSLLFRHTSLARVLKLNIEDYLILKRLLAFDPFTPVSLSANESLINTLQTLRFVERVEMVEASGFTIAELDYLLRLPSFYLGENTVGPGIDQMDSALESIRTSADPATLSTVLANVLDVSIPVARVLLQRVVSPTVSGQSAREALLEAFAPEDQNPTLLPDDSLRLLLLRLYKTALVVNRLGITHLEFSRLVDKGQAVGWLDLSALPVQGAVAIAIPDFDAWSRLVKLFQLRAALLPEQQANLFDLLAIPDQFQSAGAPYTGQERQDYAEKLAEISGWDSGDIGALIGKFDVGTISHGGGGLLKAEFFKHFADERLPLRVLAVVRRLKQLGVSAFDVEGWLGSGPAQSSRSQVGRIKNTLKTRFGDNQDEILKSLRDALREQQRLALVSYLLHKWKLTRADDLFDHFLIDVEMSPCMMTSRIIQATASVQLFVQRVLMNLEPGLALTLDGDEQWSWMKNYRVWEANRKIFLYPENWIEPELRDDKTPFFKDLENELMQADISNDVAETALLNYLEKLHEVARLQVCGQYLEKGNPSTLHIFARTRDVPHHYYYRRGLLEIDLESLLESDAQSNPLQALDASWTPWERVEVDIEGDQLIPVVYNRRVYLFWPVYTSEDEAPLTHLTQQLLQLFGQVIQVQMKLAKIFRAFSQGLGAVTIAGMTNGLIQLLTVFGNTFPIDDEFLREAKLDVRSIRRGLLGFVGVDEDWSKEDDNRDWREEAKDFDNINTLVTSLNLPTQEDYNVISGEVGEIVSSFEDHLIKLLPAKRLEVQLAWSEFKNGSWSAKKTSSAAVTFRDVISSLFENLPGLPGLGSKGVKRLFTFQGTVDRENRLFIHCNVALPQSFFDPDEESAQDNPAATAWLSEPKQIGYFRLNSCNGTLEAIDTEEELNLTDLLTQGISQLVEDATGLVEDLGIDRQLTQRGEPITPDDDPVRPSALRALLDGGISPWFSPLPKHYIPQDNNSSGIREDVYRVLARHQDSSDESKIFGFFYQDSVRVFLAFPWVSSEAKRGVVKELNSLGYIFFPFYHPYTCGLLENLQRAGIQGIYQDRYVLESGRLRQVVSMPNETGETLQLVLNDEHYFEQEYSPDTVVDDVDRSLRPIEEFNFSTIGAYSQYNWEIFFHIPLLIASRLSTNQNFREAQQWFHYIFNPTDASRGSVPEKYWRTRPFVEASQEDYSVQNIDQLLLLLNDEAEIPGLQEIEWAVRRWRRDAFNPHLVARSRTVAFQKTVVMKYIDNLIAWGDSLFRQETRESVNEAMQLYILAAKLLGPRPRRIPKSAKRVEKSFDQLKPGLDAFSNALVEFENYLPVTGTALGVGELSLFEAVAGNRGKLDRAALVRVDSAYRDLLRSPTMQDVLQNTGVASDIYFCVPANDKLLEKWDVVADRLFKIRYCRNIEGQALQLALLAPSIDPAILVRARAAGVDIDEVLGSLNMALPHYRFQTLAQKASELCGEVRSLGSALLAALEKRDGEALTLLRNTHEKRLLTAIKGIKERQIEEAKHGLAGLKASRESAVLRQTYYQRVLGEFMSPEESASAMLSASSLALQIIQFGLNWGAVPASLIPNIKGGFVTTLGGTFGGQNIGKATENAASALGSLASLLSSSGGLVSTMGGYRRRADDWQLQVETTGKELEGLAKQIAAAEIRVAIAESEMENQVLQIENNKGVNDFMQQKFTSKELYDWMVGQISTLYFQSYQLAYKLAHQAEQAFSFEFGVEPPGIIQSTHWDNLKRGLLAGDHLYQDLKRLEVTYLEKNIRDFELTKQISLTLLDPLALIRLRETGKCFLSLPEEIFDLDYPGHYFRRIKSVSLTLPCIIGPYTTISCTLRLQKNSIRTNTSNGDNGYPHNSDSGGLFTEDNRFIEKNIPVKAIAASGAQNDSGMFELNFRDERYLPFEGAGVISDWSLELFNDDSSSDFGKPLRQFDYSTISDAILHIKYTAREDSGEFKNTTVAHLRDYFREDRAKPSMRMLDLRREFPNQWNNFLHPTNPADRNIFDLEISSNLFPQRDQGKRLTVNSVWLIARCTNVEAYDIVITTPSGQNIAMALSQDEQYGGVHVSQNNVNAENIQAATTDAPVKWQLTMTRPGGGNLQKDPITNSMEVKDLVLVLGYKWE